ncbi:exodeoxyribonuclease VII small subunit [Serinicoccus kebangsaanensis]|uniref:exodeoxyribonuclease VII small subunit n=1 Tax=Serinicoccus kebangsaanensis TaxID=2602069 RepID=UPI00124F4CC8|nr:exodeoxyribonuclease VII small subunit [Serinicoccus kebangsaanensis]
MSQTPSEPEPDTPVADLTYEQARDELVALVARIESGQVPLEEAMLLWERGEQLAAHCQTKLDAAQDTLDRATGQGRSAERSDTTGGETDDDGPDDSEGDGEGDDAPDA